MLAPGKAEVGQKGDRTSLPGAKEAQYRNYNRSLPARKEALAVIPTVDSKHVGFLAPGALAGFGRQETCGIFEIAIDFFWSSAYPLHRFGKNFFSSMPSGCGSLFLPS